MDRLKDKVTIVTGAGSGIGRATALHCAAEGARVAAFDRIAEGLGNTVEAIRAAGGAALPFVVDVTDVARVRAGISGVTEAWGRLDAVFNGVGISGRRWGDGPVDQCAEEAWALVMQINLTSMFLVCKYAVQAMLGAGGGAIVNLSSVLGMVGDQDFATHAYAASKGGIIALSRAMAITYAARGIRVNVIAPGLIATPMSQRAQNDPHTLQRLPELQPLTGAMGNPEDVAAAAVYLLSDEARFLTGVVLPVDGGWTAR
jgi:NAD(P)-dependent dehydrogenase (short-subunit alcohol dehydrogenase family)